MKNVLLALLVLALPSVAFAKAPFTKEINDRFLALENEVRVQYDVALQGGGSSPSTHPLSKKLPKGAVVTSVLLYINTAFVGGAQAESLAIKCNSGSRDLMDWQNVEALGINGLIFGGLSPTAPSSLAVLTGGANPAPAKTGWVSIPEECEIVALVRNDAGYTPYSAGKATWIIKYFMK